MDDLKATLRHRIHYLLSVEAGEQRANASYPEIDALLDDLPLAEAEGAAPRAEGLRVVEGDPFGMHLPEEYMRPFVEAFVAARGGAPQKNPGHEHVWRCDYCEADDPCGELKAAYVECQRLLAAPRAEGLDVERLRTAIDNFITIQTGFDVDDAEAIAAEYDRLTRQAARLSRPSDERVPESEAGE